MTNILMVCTANICRSPMACAVGQGMARQKGLSVDFASAGTHALAGVQRADPRAVTALLKRHYVPPKTASRRVLAPDFDTFDLILAMDESNLQDLKAQCPPHCQNKLHLFLEFAPTLGLTEVPDPYHGAADGFERVLDLCEAGVQGWLASLPKLPSTDGHLAAGKEKTSIWRWWHEKLLGR